MAAIKPEAATKSHAPKPMVEPPDVAGSATAAEPSPMAALLAVMAVEAQAREATDRAALGLVIANETTLPTRARQVFFLTATRAGDFAVAAVTSLSVVDRSAPTLQWIERTIGNLGRDQGLADVREFVATAYASPADSSAQTYPFREMVWVPMKRRDQRVVAGVLLAREIPWTTKDIVVARRLAGAFAHSWLALEQSWRIPRFAISKRGVVLSAVGLAALLALPVSLTTLAPMEIAPRDGFTVTAPIDGVVDDILVAPNAAVKAGDLLFRMVDTQLKNRFEVAERDVVVAGARVKKTAQLAFTDLRARHDLAIAAAELEVKQAERDFARDQFERSQVRAPRDGIAVFTDKKDFVGRPLPTGERVMDIADPARVEARIDVPVSDAIVLLPGMRAKLYLDADPLRARDASVVRADYQARLKDGEGLVFRVVAHLGEGAVARLGVRGTAQLYGDRVPLGFYLLRRPITAFRQWTGW
jgi:hypothetical protein